MLASPRECEQGEKIMVSEEATPARYNRVLPQIEYIVKSRSSYLTPYPSESLSCPIRFPGYYIYERHTLFSYPVVLKAVKG